MNLTEYQYQILDVLGLREAFDKIDPERVDARASVWNKAQRQLWATPQSFVGGVAAIADLKITVDLCAEKHDIATAALIEVWIDETERRTWYLFEAGRRPDSSGH